MTRRWLPAIVLGLMLAAGPMTAQERTTLDGVYSTEQAAEGKLTYQRVCARCHTLDWYQGDIVRAWEGGNVYGLFEIISTTMPEDNPGSLRRGDYINVIAYILELNGLPAGPDPLPSGRSRLSSIRFQFDKENR